MAIKRGSKVETSFGSASMTDLMFLLIIFFMVATTLINNNALKIVLPQSSSKVNDRPQTTLSVTKNLQYYIDNVQVSFEELGPRLQGLFNGVEKPVLSICVDQDVPTGETIKLLNLARDNNITPYVTTRPE